LGESMKNAFVSLLMFVSMAAWATPDVNQKITMKVKNITADVAMKEISTRTNVKFIVSPNLNFTKKISIMVTEAKLRDVLDFIVAEQNVAWTAGEDNSIKITAVKK
jgi:hypothetical protein